ncbi:MAG: hypothetical protein HQL77_01075 [Magnetococcales bacterium]|nr:hypothetical protein [Magnetococcales bacterium]
MATAISTNENPDATRPPDSFSGPGDRWGAKLWESRWVMFSIRAYAVTQSSLEHARANEGREN